MAWIIVEGPTCSGKTTLFNTLKDKLGGNVNTVHMQKPDELTRAWVLRKYVTGWESPFATEGHILADRWHWGEATYAPLYRPETNNDGFGLLGKAGWRWTELFLTSRGACTALLTADNDTLAARLEERGDDHVQNLDELFQVSSLYNHARRESITTAGVFDTSGEIDEAAYATFVDTLLEEATGRSEAVADLNRAFPRYIGPVAPGVLLVGDAVVHENASEMPFIPTEDSASEYLLEALPDMFWRTCGLVNGNDDAGLAELVEALGNPPVVALGDLAHQAVINAGLESPKVPDPQHVQEHQNARQKEYGEALVVAANGGSSAWIR